MSREQSNGSRHHLAVGADFWKMKSVQELAVEQGVKPVVHLEDILGRGADLWEDDTELDLFLTTLRERRKKGG